MKKFRSPVLIAMLALSGCAFADNGFERLKLSINGSEFALKDLIGRIKHDLTIPNAVRIFGVPFIPALRLAPSFYFCSCDGTDTYLLRQSFPAGSPGTVLGPKLLNLPPNVHCFSFKETNFSPPSFTLNQTATPCLFFTDKGQALIYSPASNFMTSRLVGDGKTSVGLAFNPQVKEIKGRTTQDSLLVFAPTIHEAWTKWGQALRSLYKRKPAEDSQDILLKKFGYWTDNGADYYYNYDLSRGYANTLLDLRKRYQDEGIPLGYMQLDSWWYEKSTTDATGKFSGAIKNKKLPAGEWNRYGGLLKYKTDPFLFPSGLEAFQNQLGLPLATHNRWMDVNSPYRDRFKVSGVAAVDPRFWNEIASYISSSGVTCYEQDWLNVTYDNTPEMASDESVGDAFTGNMAKACQRDGLTMQYCMATPRFMMQAVKYPNLTTIRTSDDRFGPDRWHNFIYVSELANAVGARPWCDVFKSSETANMILAVLSGGPVGTGDLMGKEDKANIMKAVRRDGVIVRPDAPLLPTDRTFINEAEGVDAPFVAETRASRDLYFFAFMKGGNDNEAMLDMAPGDYYLYNCISGEGAYVHSRGPVDVQVGRDGYGYWMACPVDKSGATVLGDLDMFVATGRNRLSSISELRGEHTFEVVFAPTEKSLKISGVGKSPRITGVSGGTAYITYTDAIRRFIIDVKPEEGQRRVSVKFRTQEVAK